ncbi:ComEC/Rec2 family competence protein [Chitinophaga solisilvae]|uniref:ComEC/Rec2 family competence protein n=1 Tax=Chitinophaga solisilvae TaxID=1233460 RepID=UPI00137227BA|nr:ComEC/Rec2 family competence protein [Chitinophaga solisilvae]
MQFESSMFVNAPWKRVPFVRLIVPLVAGITAQLFIPVSLYWLLLMIVMAAAGLWMFRRLPLQYRYSAGFAPGVLLFVLLYSAGAVRVYTGDIRHRKGYFANVADSSACLLVQIAEPLQEKTRSRKTVLSVIAVCHGKKTVPAKGRILAFFSRDSSSALLRYGDRLLIAKMPVTIRSSGNPGTFDYKAWCAAQQICHQWYLQPADYRLLPEKDRSILTGALLQAKDYCLHTLKKYTGEGPEAGMAEALLIGYRQDLDKDLVQSYSNTGIVHVIAISGMHLALLYGTLLWLLRWLPQRRLADAGRAAVVITILWAFALLTGASASVLRSAVMFTGITIGRFVLQRPAVTYNTLAASAFLLLWYDPWMVTDAGFQLSYLAVLSILLFYQPLFRLLYFPQKWLEYIWQMIAVSLAAQVLTLPVSIWYFHQFPNYFLPANLIAVPLSTVVIYGEIVLLLVSPFPPLAVWTGTAIRYLIMYMNACVHWLGTLPYALIKNMHLSLAQTCWLYLLIAGLALWWLARWKPGLWLAVISCWCSIALQAWWEIDCRRQRMLIIYNVTGYTAIDCVDGKRVQFAGQDTIFTLAAGQAIAAGRLHFGLQPGTVGNFARYGNYIRFAGRQLVIIDRALPGGMAEKKFRTDYLLLNNNPQVTIAAVMAYYDCRQVIIGAANSIKRTAQWKEECSKAGIACHIMTEQGAFMKQL